MHRITAYHQLVQHTTLVKIYSTGIDILGSRLYQNIRWRKASHGNFKIQRTLKSVSGRNALSAPAIVLAIALPSDNNRQLAPTSSPESSYDRTAPSIVLALRIDNEPTDATFKTV